LDLSIVIVNYNVKEFLTQCLDSIFRSQTQYSYEVIVVDNASKQKAQADILARFPQTVWVANSTNVGFGKANNQGFALAQGTYTLILNPDTVLAEDTLEKCLSHMMAHPEIGGLGIKGLDGSGKFLPESKRALPTPLVALWKISGLSALFPRSPIFARYHLGHLSPEQNHEVDILVGCFMLVPTTLLLEVGGFDPRYFMYGEDIDLSYELLKTGKKNVYFADSSIIHYKGESTKRGSLNYVRMFYQAMVLFAKKQFSGSSAAAYTLLIYLGIYLRAALALLARLGRSAFAPVLDALLLFGTLETVKTYWELNHRFVDGGSYPDLYTYGIQSAYVLFWILSLGFSGLYLRSSRPAVFVRTMGIATVAIGFFYGLLPEELRFSRALLVLGALGGTAVLLFWRSALGALTGKKFFSSALRQPRLLFYGTKEHSKAINDALAQSRIAPSFFWHESYGTAPQQLSELIHLHRVDELIIDASVSSYTEVIAQLQACGSQCSVKTYHSDSGYIIGSDSSLTQGGTYRKSVQTSDPTYLRQRRLMNAVLPIVLMLFLPLTLPLAAWSGRTRSYFRILAQFPALLRQKRSLVGYSQSAAEKNSLPELAPPIFDICTVIPENLDFSQNEKAIVENYAIETSLKADILHLWHLSK
jgi:GT2 family glycosyltransferase